eukprot:403365943
MSQTASAENNSNNYLSPLIQHHTKSFFNNQQDQLQPSAHNYQSQSTNYQSSKSLSTPMQMLSPLKNKAINFQQNQYNSSSQKGQSMNSTPLLTYKNGDQSCQQSTNQKSAHNIYDEQQVEDVKHQIKAIYEEIQKLSDKRDKYIEKYKQKSIKASQTDNLIKSELQLIDENFKKAEVKHQAKVSKLETQKLQKVEEIQQSINEIEKLELLRQDFINKAQQLEQLMREILSQKDIEGNFIYKNRQIEDDNSSLETIDQQINQIEKSKELIIEHDMMTYEDVSSQFYRVQNLQETVEWKQRKVKGLEDKIIKGNGSQNVIQKLKSDLEQEMQLITQLQQQINSFQQNEIPHLNQQYDFIGRMIESQDQTMLQLLNQKELLLNRLRGLYKQNDIEQSQPSNNVDEDIRRVSLLNVNKQQFLFKVTETEVKIQAIKEKTEELYAENLLIDQQKEHVSDEYKQELFQITEKQMQLYKFKEQFESKIKPSLVKMDSKINKVGEIILSKKNELLQIQRQLNTGMQRKDYQMISSLSQLQLNGTCNQYINEEVLNKDEMTMEQIQQAELNLLENIAKFQTQRPSNDYIHQSSIHQFDRQAEQTEISTPFKELHQNQVSLSLRPQSRLTAFNNPDFLYRIKPLLQGVEIYKKTFNTKLLTSLSAPQRYNILTDNKRVTPELVGYQLRMIKLQQDDIMKLEFINAHEPNHINESDVIDLQKTRLVVPKDTLDSLKEQRKDKNPVHQVQEKYFTAFDRSICSQDSQNLRKENTFIREQKLQYNEKCKHVQYFSLMLVYDDKEVDVLVSNAGGHYNFMIVKDAIESLIQSKKGQINKLQKEIKNKQQ